MFYPRNGALSFFKDITVGTSTRVVNFKETYQIPLFLVQGVRKHFFGIS